MLILSFKCAQFYIKIKKLKVRLNYDAVQSLSVKIFFKGVKIIKTQ